MTPTESTRQAVLAHVAAFHASAYPTLEVNYPDLFLTKIESSSRFVTVELGYEVAPMDLGRREYIQVLGTLLLRHHIRKGVGTKTENQYTDAVIDWFMEKTIGSTTYQGVRPFKVGESVAGFQTVSNRVNFRMEFYS